MLLCLFAGMTAPERQPLAQEASQNPNIVFVLADDLDVALAEQMPNISQKVEAQGVSFVRAYNSFPLCCPSRATILTGLYAHNHGVKSNRSIDGGWAAFREGGHEENTVAVALDNAGYRTGLFGKYLNGYPGGSPPPGWDTWVAVESKTDLDYYNYDLDENGTTVHYGDAPGDYITDVLSEKTTTFIRESAASEEPFFAFVAPKAPHLPATPAERHQNLFPEDRTPRPPSFDEDNVADKPPWIRSLEPLGTEQEAALDELYRNRKRSMMAVDEMVEAILAELKRTGELTNTYVFFTSDNGWLNGEHRVAGDKRYPYEESAETPLFVRGPGVPTDSTVRDLVINTDYAETFADIAGTNVDGDGRSLVPLLRGQNVAWRRRILLEGFATPSSPPAYAGLRTTRYKYIEYEGGFHELYDLRADPYELKNAYPNADTALRRSLRAKLAALRSCTGDSCRTAEGP